VTFRAGVNGAVNSLTLSDLQHQWNRDLVDPNHCSEDDVVSTEGANGEGYEAWYSPTDCFLSITSAIPDGSTLGSTPYYEFDPGFLFYDFWIGDQKVWVWAPANGSDVTISYYRPSTDDYVIFFEEPANYPDTTLVTEHIEYEDFDEQAPRFQIEVRRSMWTESDYFGPEDEGCLGATSQLAQCERFYDNVTVQMSSSDPSINWGIGWAEMAENGGKVTFLSAQNEMVTLILGPGNYRTGEIGTGGDT